MCKHNINVPFAAQDKSSNFSEIKDPRNILDKSNVVYNIPCADCNGHSEEIMSQKLRISQNIKEYSTHT